MNKKLYKTKNLILAGGLGYLAAAGALAAKDWAGFYRQNHKCRDHAYGEARLGNGGVKECFIYSEEEMSAGPKLRDVKLYFFPAVGAETKPYVIFLPGGAYLKCDPKEVALPCAAEVNDAGYCAFILRYRTRRHTDDFGPLDDLAAAIRYISEHAADFNVSPENYMITGFSAGGNLAGLFGSQSLGYMRCGLPKPAALSLIYPWSNINARIKPSGNIVSDAYKLLGRALAENVLIGLPAGKSRGEMVCVHNQLDADYPPCFIAHGDHDFLAPKELNSDLLVKRLAELGVAHEYHVYPGLTHGFGIGRGTCAEGWLNESLEFWQKQF